MVKYFTGLEKAYAVPIDLFMEVSPVTLGELQARFPRFTPPQSYVFLNIDSDTFKYLESLIPKS